VAATLNDRIRSDECSVRLLVNEQATRQNVVQAIGEDLPRMVGEDDAVLIYFACHGSPESDPSTDDVSLYLVLHDTEYKRIFSSGIDMERELTRTIIRSHKKIRAWVTVFLPITS
jgi:hypothetical protein